MSGWTALRSAGMTALRRLRGASGGAVVLLTYHRIADADADPRHVALPTARFAEHVAMLASRYELMTAGQVFAILAEDKRLPRRAVCITIDDGYADVLTNALPALRAHGAPASVFVCSGFLDGRREFWWDELERVVLLGEGPAPRVSIEVPGASGFAREGATDRAELYDDLCAYVEPLPAGVRERGLAAIREAFGAVVVVRPEKRTLGVPELIELESGDLVEIGAHTVSHAHLASLPPARQRDEILGGKRTLEAACGHAIRSFAYPYGTTGAYTAETRAIVHDAGFLGACTTRLGSGLPWGSASRGTDRYQVPRTATSDVPAEDLARLIDKRLGL